MLKIRDAKPLFALTTLLFPWDLFLYGRGIGWGLTFAFGRYAVTAEASNVISIPYYLVNLDRFDPISGIGVILWTLAAVFCLAAAALAVVDRFDATPTDWPVDRTVGLLILAAATTFVASRAFFYDFLFVSGPQKPEWFSVPFGLLYVGFVGYIFYTNRFRLGAD